MNKKLIITLVILALVIVGVLLYSNQPAPETKKEEVSVSNPDTITKVNMGTIDSLDPHFQFDAASQEIYVNVYENLIRFERGDITQFKPMLATKVPSDDNGLIKDNGTTYVFPIREGVKFHEGGTLIPEDVQYSFLRSLIQDREGGPTWMLYDPLFGVGGLSDVTKEVVGVEDPKTLTAEQSREVYNYLAKAIEVDGQHIIFHLPKPYPPFLSIICHDNGLAAIMDKEWAIEQGVWDGRPETIAKYYDPTKEADPLYEKTNGTGPFRLENWAKGESITFKRNDDYWRDPAKVENVVIKFVDEWSTRKLMLQRGDADIVYVDDQYLDQARALEDVRVISGLPRLSIGVGLMNWNIVSEGNPDVHSGKLDGKGIPSDFFSDFHVRKGFAYSMNYQAFVDEVLKGDGQQARGPVPDGFLGFNGDSDVYTMDLDKAAEEFKQAFDGELWDKGFEITILYNTGNDMRKTAVDMLKTNVEGINDKFKVHVRGVQWATYLDKQIAGKFTLGFIGWNADFADPHNFVVPFMRSDGTYGKFKGEDYAKFTKDQGIDKLIARAVELTDPAEREKIYQKLQQTCYDYATDIYLYQSAAHVVMRDWISGWEYDPILDTGENFYYLDK